MEEWLNSPLIIVAGLAVLGALVGIGRFIWAASRWVHGVDHGKARVDEDRSLFQSFMIEIRDDIKKILVRLPPAATTSASPSRLTDFGKEIAEKIHAYTWAKDLAPMIADSVTGKAAFEIDEFCQTYISTELNATMKAEVARVAYEFGIDRVKVGNVLRIVLRDELLQLATVKED